MAQAYETVSQALRRFWSFTAKHDADVMAFGASLLYHDETDTPAKLTQTNEPTRAKAAQNSKNERKRHVQR